MRTPRKTAVTALVALSLLVACQDVTPSNQIPAQSTVCSAGEAELALGDSYLEIFCGCQEGPGYFVGPQTSLSCTLPVGTVVFFYFFGTSQTHQILSVGSPSFLSSMVWNPGDSLNVHAVSFSTPGTYAFQDAFNAALVGKITAQ